MFGWMRAFCVNISRVCLAVANEQTENLIGEAALARMQTHAVFINLSRGNLVDEAVELARAADAEFEHR